MKQTLDQTIQTLAFKFPIALVTLAHIALLMIGIPVFGAVSLYTAAVFGGLISNLVTTLVVLHQTRPPF